MDRGYRVRPAVPRDIASLPAIELAAARLFVAYGEVLGLTPEMLERPTSVKDFAKAQKAGLLWVVATPEGAPVGFARLRELDDAVHLDELDVHPSHGRRGLGSALLRRVCEWAQSAGRRGVTLSTFRDVPWNAPYYARRGFRVLTDAEMTPGLRSLREAEKGRGLRTDLRVVMRYEGRQRTRTRLGGETGGARGRINLPGG